MPKDYIFYGEIYGYKVQKMHYGLTSQTLDVFNMVCNWNYLDLKKGKKTCEDLGLSFVQIHEAEFKGLDWAREIANSPSEVYDGFREGIVIVSAEDTKNHKPHPEPILHACKLLKVKPENAIYVGDSIFDYRSAKDANVEFVAVLTGDVEEKEFRENGVKNIIDSVTELPKFLKL